jgi:magnesium-transporting ATPase (P-type)
LRLFCGSQRRSRFFAEWREPGQGMATLGFAIVGVILINGVCSFWQAYRAEQALAALKKLLPNATKVVRSGAVRQVSAAQLVPGDVILLEAGDILPADCRLLEAFSVRVNNATVTSESLPASGDAEPCDEPDPIHSRNTLLAGASLVSGEAKALVFATGSHSAFGKIALLSQATADTISPLQVEIVRVSRIIAGLALAAAPNRHAGARDGLAATNTRLSSPAAGSARGCSNVWRS